MVPEGLVLLTSLAFAIAAVTLARRKVLVQELPAVEGLARVDVVCLDKTGTLTEGSDRVRRGRAARRPCARSRDALGALADDENRNATASALAEAFPHPTGWTRDGAVPFSSARKWSAATFDGHGTWVLGAPEMVWSHPPTIPCARTGRRARGRRAAGSCCSRTATQPLAGEELPADLAAGRARDASRRRSGPTRPTRCAYFTEQGVALKVISGDNPRTVGAVAGAGRPARRRRAGRRPRAARGPRRAGRRARSARRCSAGSRRTRSGRWSARCSRAATSSR